MINHLEVSTATALVCVLAALAFRGRYSNAWLRHLLLLIGVLRFAVYTPWLAAAGASLARFVPAHHVPAPRLVHVTLRLLIPDPHAPARPPAPKPYDWHRWREAAGWLWYAGAGLGLGALLGRWMRPVPPIRAATFWERDLFLQAAERSRAPRRAELWIVSPEEVPGAQGWVHPRVLLPDGLINSMTDAEIQAVLAHELAHLRRRDPLLAGMVRAVVSVFWFHPLLWWMESRLLAERETACDELVLEGGARPEDYVAGIAKVCRSALWGTQNYASVTGANLTRRIERILSGQTPRLVSRKAGLLPVALALAAMMLPVMSGLLKAQSAQKTLAEQLQAALALDAAGQSTQAALLYQQILREDPDNVVPLNNLAFILAEKGQDLNEALALAGRAHQLKPESLDVDDTLGWVYLKRNQPDPAILAFRDPVLKQPNNFVFRSHMAQALDEKTNPPEWMRELRGLIFTSGREEDALLKERLEMIGR